MEKIKNMGFICYKEFRGLRVWSRLITADSWAQKSLKWLMSKWGCSKRGMPKSIGFLCIC